MPALLRSWVLTALGAAACFGCQGTSHDDGRCDGVETRASSASSGDACEPHLIASDPRVPGINAVALDATRVYWTFGVRISDGGQQRDGAVNAVLLDGGEVENVASDQYVPMAIALGKNDVFWFDEVARWIVSS